MDHDSARRPLWEIVAFPGACIDEQLSITATVVAAELQVSRSSDFLVTDNSQVAFWRQGRQIGLISFFGSAATYNGVKFDGFAIAHRGWGLREEAGPDRRMDAMRDLSVSPRSLHQSPWRLAECLARLLTARSGMGLGWIKNYLFSYAARPPLERDPPKAPSSSDCDANRKEHGLGAEREAKRR